MTNKVPFGPQNVLIDVDCEIERYFAHEYVSLMVLQQLKENESFSPDVFTKRTTSRFKKAFISKSLNGNFEEFIDSATKTSNEIEDTNEHKTIGWLNQRTDSDTLIISLASLAGLEWRLFTPNLSFTSGLLHKTTSDILVVQESSFRLPESRYPSFYMEGIDNDTNTFELLVEKIRTEIKNREEKYNKKFRKITLYGDSKHCAATISIFLHLQDIVEMCIVTHGHATYDYKVCPWYNAWMEWKDNYWFPNRYKNPKPFTIHMPTWGHILKILHFRDMGLDSKILDPVRQLEHANIDKNRIYYFYGDKDLPHQLQLDYVKQFEDYFTLFPVYTPEGHDIHRIKPLIEDQWLESLTN